ncbi:MAG TPA: TlpA disulfide reductase family protein [Burkholderiales bacterium]|nr:TlpA disulfide reductase family protein [Burkholderiales bacterium]
MRFFTPLMACCLLAASTAAVTAAEFKPVNTAPPSSLALKDLSGRVHRLSDYRGKVVLINFWATWCEPCREEMPSLERLRQKLADRPFVVLAVNVDEPEARIAKFLAAMPLDFPVLVDAGSKLTRSWKVRVLPASFLIGPDGRVRYTVVGELDWSAPAVVERITKLLPAR